MTWTYSGDPSLNDRDMVRFKVGDTDSTDPLVTDEEIAAMLSTYGNSIVETAIAICRALAIKFGRIGSVSVDDVRIDGGTIAKQFLDQAESLRQEQVLTGVVPYAGGISVSDKELRESDTDQTDPFFTREWSLSSPSWLGSTTDEDDEE